MSIDEIREQKYAETRAAAEFAGFHAKVRRGDPGWPMEVVRALTWPTVLLLWRFRSVGIENLPKSGPVVLAANHASFADHFLVGVASSRQVNYMAKSQLFKGILGWGINLMGGFPVRRGSGGLDEEAFATARAVLARGSQVVVYPQAGRARGDEFGGPARPGLGRIVLDNGAPVVPLAIVGSARIRGWRRGRFPRITVVFGEPMHFDAEPGASRERHQEVADAVLAQSRILFENVRR